LDDPAPVFSPHFPRGDKFLGGGGVDADSRVENRLGGACRQGDGGRPRLGHFLSALLW